MTNLAQTNTYPFSNVTLSTQRSNVTGDGTIYTIILDTQSSGSGYNTSTGVFTAPSNNYYLFTYVVQITGLTSSHTLGVLKLNTTFGNFQLQYLNIQAAKNGTNAFTFSGCCPVRMSENDTASFTVQISNGTKVASVDINSILYIEGIL